MELSNYLHILKKRFLLIIIIVLLSTSVSCIFSFYIIKPVYKADISVIINKEETENINQTAVSYNDIMMFQQLVKTYSQFITSRKVAEDVVKSLNLNMPLDTLISMVTVAPQANTQFMDISVKSNNPREAAKIANQLALSFKIISADVMGSDNVRLLDEAQVPTAPSSPNKKLNIAIGFFLGFMISIGLAFLIEYLDNTVKIPEEVEDLIDLPIIGLIPFVNKK